jgi:hypothetical protein
MLNDGNNPGMVGTFSTERPGIPQGAHYGRVLFVGHRCLSKLKSIINNRLRDWDEDPASIVLHQGFALVRDSAIVDRGRWVVMRRTQLLATINLHLL